MKSILKSLLFLSEAHCSNHIFSQEQALSENSRGLAKMKPLNKNCQQSHHEQSTIYLI